MAPKHNVLLRQLKRLKLTEDQSPTLEDWHTFLESVSSVYRQSEEDRQNFEHSIQLASTEMKERLEKDKEMSLQLLQANKLASIGTLASGVAHELNNPLSSIRGFLEILLESPNITSEEVDLLKKVKAQSERMTAIVSHMLKLSRKPTKQKEEKINLKQAVREIFDFYEPQLRVAGVTVHENIPASLHIVSFSHQLTSIIQNLINNCLFEFSHRQFQPTHQKEIHLEASLDEKTGQVMMTFKDNAGGIPTGVIEKIFDPFFTTKDVGKGTGLGLSLSRQIAREYGGDLTVKSADQQTTFFLTFRKFEEASDSTTVTSLTQGTTTAAIPRTPGTRPKVLVVDDEPDHLQVLKFNLKNYFDVTTFSDPTEALEACRSDKFHILLSDLKMPKMTGEQLAMALAQLRPEMSLVIMSGHVVDQDDLDPLLAGKVALLTKPLPPRVELVQFLNNLLMKQERAA